jgi:hypothetical protein
MTSVTLMKTSLDKHSVWGLKILRELLYDDNGTEEENCHHYEFSLVYLQQ